MRPAIVAGIAAVVLGFVAVLDRGVAGLFDLDYVFVTLVGILAGALGIYFLNLRREDPRELTAFDDPERRYRATVPGDDLDGRIAVLALESRFRSPRQRIRDRLREAAVGALVAYAGYDRAAAVEAVEDGSWTDDPVAAGFLAENGSYPRRLRIRAFFGRVELSDVGARRCVEAISAVIEA